MAVEFLTDEQAAWYGAFYEAPSRAELERYFFLDDADQEVVQAKRRAHNRLGFAVQLTSVRFLGRFMADPRQVPAEVVEYLAGQLEIEDVSCLEQYGERDGTARTHAGEIWEAGGWRSCRGTEWTARRRCCAGTRMPAGWRRCWRPRSTSPRGRWTTRWTCWRC